MSHALPAYSALLLAGGSSRRFHGADKALQPLNGMALYRHVLHALQSQTPPPGEILISANRHHDCYAAHGYPVLSDTLPGYQGPLAGIAQGLQHAHHDWLLVAPCDMPQLPHDLAARLFSAAAPDTEVVVACDPQSLHPVLALLHTRLAPRLEEFLHGDSRRLRDFYAACRCREAWFDTPLANLNSPELLAALQHSGL